MKYPRELVNRMSEELSQYFPEDEIKPAEKLVKFFHGQFLISDELSDTDAILLITYMLSNKQKSPKVKSDDVRNLFTQSGRSTDAFSKAIYELVKRAKKPFMTKDEEGKLSLTFTGLSKIKEMLK